MQYVELTPYVSLGHGSHIGRPLGRTDTRLFMSHVSENNSKTPFGRINPMDHIYYIHFVVLQQVI